VIKARARQELRQGVSNARLAGHLLETHCLLNEESKKLLTQTAERLGWSARSFHRVMRIARTLADLGEREQPNLSDVAQAIGFRRLFSGAK
jgi:magnesium chelatase family protein